MTLSLMPKDLPLPVDQNNGTFVPAGAQEVNEHGPERITAWDPWTHSNVALMADKSQPLAGDNNYGEATYYKAGEINAEWGGMPSPVRDYQDMSGSVLHVKGRNKTQGVTGPGGQFNGPAEAANALTYVDPTSDYWSVIVGG